MKRSPLLLTLAGLLVLLPCGKARAQAMSDYCLVPPYVVQNVPPDVMIVVDNSGSMFNFAYYDGFNTSSTSDDNMCDNSTSPCTGFTNPGAYPTYKYYGYFNADYWYTYSTNRFVPSAPKTGSGLSGARDKLAAEWDGNFLNWLTMRRTDVLRKVLTGGRRTTGEGSGYDRLVGEEPDITDRGAYRRIATAENYTPYNGTRRFVFQTGSGTASFLVRNVLDTGNDATCSVAVRVTSPVSGVLQDVATKTRLGLTFYNTNTGGFVQVAITGASLSSVVNQVNLTRPSANTPMAETLWTVTGYFAQVSTLLGGDGPRYNSGDYQINNNNDPFNYGTGGAPRWPTCSRSFVLFITDGEPCSDGNLPASLSDYASGKSRFNCADTSCPSVSATSPETFSFSASSFPSCGAGGNVAGIEDVALYMHTTDLRSSTIGVSNMTGNQVLTLYPVLAFGKGSTLLRYAAINGAFEDSNGNLVPDLQSEWDKNGDNQPDAFFEATDGAQLETAVKNAISNMLTRVASGTAASVLASGEGSGANLIQASFYPRRRFGDDVITWVGGLQNLWYHLDPMFTRSNMREDTVQDNVLNLQNDYIMQFYFDYTAQATKAARTADVNGDGTVLTPVSPAIPFEDVKNIWEAAQMLWGRDLAAAPRTIYTSLTGTTLLAGGFSTANAAVLAPSLQMTDANGNGSVDDEAVNLIRYVHGEDIIQDIIPAPSGDGTNDYRTRTVTIGSGTNVWKLGDILNSTPKIASWVPLNHYWTFYQDSTYDDFTKTTEYLNRGAVFVGANDGMFHTFHLGNLELEWSGQGALEKARLTGSDLGKELWAFIPKNVLPYLKYVADADYCHVYTVDLTPFLFDASIAMPTGCTGNYWECDKDVTSWRTIIIGGMRFGGACRNSGTACADVSGDGAKDCVNTPAANQGYSSYFALDVTDQNNPQLLWEFSNPALGFATTGPAIIRISARDPDTGEALQTKNGKWFIVLGSGPTGPIDTANQQFMGRSDQNLKFFVLDLKTGALLRTIDTEMPYTFAGSMYNSTHDINWSDVSGGYQDDVMYFPYTRRTSASPYTWTDGGIGRIMTLEDLDPAAWVWNKVIDGIGPVTSSVQKLDDTDAGNMWLFFGTGRYYYALGTTLDDANSQRRIFGIKDPCASVAAGTDHLQLDPACTTLATVAELTSVTSISSVPSQATANGSSFKGWYIDLDSAGTYTYSPDPGRSFGAERVITDPLSATNGLVYFTTYKPYGEECSLGGKTFIWVVMYNTGGSGGTLLTGKVLVQVSTGSIEQVDLATSITGAGGRKSAAIEGEPPIGQGIAAVVAPPSISRVLQIKER